MKRRRTRSAQRDLDLRKEAQKILLEDLADPYRTQMRMCTAKDHQKKRSNCAHNPNCLWGLGEYIEGVWRPEKELLGFLGSSPEQSLRWEKNSSKATAESDVSGVTSTPFARGKSPSQRSATSSGAKKPNSRIEHNDAGAPMQKGRMGVLPAGLRNLGATCYLNSLLQSLFMNYRFRASVYAYKEVGDAGYSPRTVDWFGGSKHKSVITELQRVFGYLQLGKENVVNPTNLAKALKLNRALQQDAQEFNKLLMNHLEGTLGSVADLYRGRLQYSTRCLGCRRISATPSFFYELELAIEDDITVETCFERYFNEENLSGSNQYYCAASCGQKTDAVRKTEILELPEVLTLQLLRFGYDRECQTKRKLKYLVDIPYTLDLNWLLPARQTPRKRSANKEKYIYHLVAVLHHQGGSPNVGHYTAEVKQPGHGGKGDWYMFDDEKVVSCSTRVRERQSKSQKVVSSAKKKLKKSSRRFTDKQGSAVSPIEITPGRQSRIRRCRPQTFKAESDSDFEKTVSSAGDVDIEEEKDYSEDAERPSTDWGDDDVQLLGGTKFVDGESLDASSAIEPSCAKANRNAPVNGAPAQKVAQRQKSRNAYMLIYRRASVDDSEEPAVPEWLRKEIEESNAALDAKASALRHRAEVFMAHVQQRRREYEEIFGPYRKSALAANDESKDLFCWVPTKWLKRWIKGFGEEFESHDGKLANSGRDMKTGSINGNKSNSDGACASAGTDKGTEGSVATPHRPKRVSSISQTRSSNRAQGKPDGTSSRKSPPAGDRANGIDVSTSVQSSPIPSLFRSPPDMVPFLCLHSRYNALGVNCHSPCTGKSDSAFVPLREREQEQTESVAVQLREVNPHLHANPFFIQEMKRIPVGILSAIVSKCQRDEVSASGKCFVLVSDKNVRCVQCLQQKQRQLRSTIEFLRNIDDLLDAFDSHNALSARSITAFCRTKPLEQPSRRHEKAPDAGSKHYSGVIALESDDEATETDEEEGIAKRRALGMAPREDVSGLKTYYRDQSKDGSASFETGSSGISPPKHKASADLSEEQERHFVSRTFVAWLYSERTRFLRGLAAERKLKDVRQQRLPLSKPKGHAVASNGLKEKKTGDSLEAYEYPPLSFTSSPHTPSSLCVNADLVCAHDNLKIDPTLCIEVAAKTWLRVKSLFSNVRAFPVKEGTCLICQRQDSRSLEHFRQQREERDADLAASTAIATLYSRKTGIHPAAPQGPREGKKRKRKQEPTLKDIWRATQSSGNVRENSTTCTVGQGEQKTSTSSNGEEARPEARRAARFFLVARPWMTRWRAYVDEVNQPRPGIIRNSALLCLHGRPVVPLRVRLLCRKDVKKSLLCSPAWETHPLFMCNNVHSGGMNQYGENDTCLTGGSPTVETELFEGRSKDSSSDSNVGNDAERGEASIKNKRGSGRGHVRAKVTNNAAHGFDTGNEINSDTMDGGDAEQGPGSIDVEILSEDEWTDLRNIYGCDVAVFVEFVEVGPAEEDVHKRNDVLYAVKIGKNEVCGGQTRECLGSCVICEKQISAKEAANMSTYAGKEMAVVELASTQAPPGVDLRPSAENEARGATRSTRRLSNPHKKFKVECDSQDLVLLVKYKIMQSTDYAPTRQKLYCHGRELGDYETLFDAGKRKQKRRSRDQQLEEGRYQDTVKGDDFGDADFTALDWDTIQAFHRRSHSEWQSSADITIGKSCGPARDTQSKIGASSEKKTQSETNMRTKDPEYRCETRSNGEGRVVGRLGDHRVERAFEGSFLSYTNSREEFEKDLEVYISLTGDSDRPEEREQDAELELGERLSELRKWKDDGQVERKLDFSDVELVQSRTAEPRTHPVHGQRTHGRKGRREEKEAGQLQRALEESQMLAKVSSPSAGPEILGKKRSDRARLSDNHATMTGQEGSQTSSKGFAEAKKRREGVREKDSFEADYHRDRSRKAKQSPLKESRRNPQQGRTPDTTDKEKGRVRRPWTCGWCTLINPPESFLCEACCNEREVQQASDLKRH